MSCYKLVVQISAVLHLHSARPSPASCLLAAVQQITATRSWSATQQHCSCVITETRLYENRVGKIVFRWLLYNMYIRYVGLWGESINLFWPNKFQHVDRVHVPHNRSRTLRNCSGRVTPPGWRSRTGLARTGWWFSIVWFRVLSSRQILRRRLGWYICIEVFRFLWGPQSLWRPWFPFCWWLRTLLRRPWPFWTVSGRFRSALLFLRRIPGTPWPTFGLWTALWLRATVTVSSWPWPPPASRPRSGTWSSAVSAPWTWPWARVPEYRRV